MQKIVDKIGHLNALERDCCTKRVNWSSCSQGVAFDIHRWNFVPFGRSVSGLGSRYVAFSTSWARLPLAAFVDSAYFSRVLHHPFNSSYFTSFYPSHSCEGTLIP